MKTTEQDFHTVLLPVDKLKEYDKNPRIISDQAVDSVAKSIEAHGFNQPIVVNQDYIIVAGHTRYRAAKKLGLKKVPVWQRHMSEEEFKGYNIADNKVAEAATWDLDILRDIFSDEEVADALKNLHTGFSDEEIDKIAGKFEADMDNLPDFEEKDDAGQTIKGIRQMILVFPEDQFEDFSKKVKKMMEKRGIPTISHMVHTLLEETYGKK